MKNMHDSSNDNESSEDDHSVFPFSFERPRFDQGALSEMREWGAKNRALYQELKTFKNRIDNQRKWDIAKKCANEHEFIFSFNHDGVADFLPISRSYFKMIELLKDNALMTPQCKRAACLCEGPGGFVQALNDRSAELGVALDPIHCITLISNNKKVPNWKMSSLSNLVVSVGVDGTGDIYKVWNIDFFAREVGANSCDIVTADGGFDFSEDFNSQETDFVRLLLCEVYACMLVQRVGGVFVAKMFDLFHPCTLQILSLLRTMYDTVSIHKPKTSRPANSEKYVICKGYSPPSNQVFVTVRSHIMGTGGDIACATSPHIYADTLRQVTAYNERFVRRQARYIQKTLDIIQSNVFDKRKHLDVCRAWCVRYGIPLKAAHAPSDC